MINIVTEDIIKKFNINKFIETGVFQGDTFMIMQHIFCKLYGDEFNVGVQGKGARGKYRLYEVEYHQKYIDQFLSIKVQNHINVEVACAESSQWLKNKIDSNEFTNDDNCLFYLDAHYHDTSKPNPLRDEINQILRLKNKPIISIDDWQVPNHPDQYSLDQIRDLLKDRTDATYITSKHNFHDQYSVFIFVDRYSSELKEELIGLKLIKEIV
jgi:hypothetical protein